MDTSCSLKTRVCQSHNHQVLRAVFQKGNCSLDDETRLGWSVSGIMEAVSQFLREQSVFFPHVLANRVVTGPDTIRNILTRDFGM
jgi:hypothetical protein